MKLNFVNKKLCVLFTNVLPAIDEEQRSSYLDFNCLCVTFPDEIFLHKCKDEPIKMSTM